MLWDNEVTVSKKAKLIEVIITYLEMTRRPHLSEPLSRIEELAILRARKPTISFYRYLYHTVGEPWLWYERRTMSDDTLSGIIHDNKVSIFVLYVAGVPAGFAELDARIEAEIELAYFGLVPEFIGRGLGSYFLRWAVDKAWSAEPRRVWVNTCSLDHPQALTMYQKAGFTPYRRDTKSIEDPRGASGQGESV